VGGSSVVRVMPVDDVHQGVSDGLLVVGQSNGDVNDVAVGVDVRGIDKFDFESEVGLQLLDGSAVIDVVVVAAVEAASVEAVAATIVVVVVVVERNPELDEDRGEGTVVGEGEAEGEAVTEF